MDPVKPNTANQIFQLSDLPTDLIGLIIHFLEFSLRAHARLSLTSSFWKTEAFRYVTRAIVHNPVDLDLYNSVTRPSRLFLSSFPTDNDRTLFLEQLCGSVQRLDLDLTQFTPNPGAFEHMASRMSNLTNLFSFVKAQQTPTVSLAKLIPAVSHFSQLRRLVCWWDSDTLPELLNAVANSCRKLQNLEIEVFEGDNLIRDAKASVELIAEPLKRITSLQTLLLPTQLREVVSLSQAVAESSSLLTQAMLDSLRDKMPLQLRSLNHVFGWIRLEYDGFEDVPDEDGESNRILVVPILGYLLGAATTREMGELIVEQMENINEQLGDMGDTALTYLLCAKFSRKFDEDDDDDNKEEYRRRFANPEKIRWLISRGANPHQAVGMASILPSPSSELSYDCRGSSLHWAVVWAHPDDATALLSTLDFQALDDRFLLNSEGFTPLHHMPRYFETWSIFYETFKKNGLDMLLRKDNPALEPPIMTILASSQWSAAERHDEEIVIDHLLSIAQLCPPEVLGCRNIRGESLLYSVLMFFGKDPDLPADKVTRLLDMILAAEETISPAGSAMTSTSLGLVEWEPENMESLLYNCFLYHQTKLFPIMLRAVSDQARSACLVHIFADQFVMNDTYSIPERLKVVDEFINAGVDINYVWSTDAIELPEHMANQANVLSLAAYEEFSPFVLELIKRGADPLSGPWHLNPLWQIYFLEPFQPALNEVQTEIYYSLMGHAISRGSGDRAIPGMQALCFVGAQETHFPSHEGMLQGIKDLIFKCANRLVSLLEDDLRCPRFEPITYYSLLLVLGSPFDLGLVDERGLRLKLAQHAFKLADPSLLDASSKEDILAASSWSLGHCARETSSWMVSALAQFEREKRVPVIEPRLKRCISIMFTNSKWNGLKIEPVKSILGLRFDRTIDDPFLDEEVLQFLAAIRTDNMLGPEDFAALMSMFLLRALESTAPDSMVKRVFQHLDAAVLRVLVNMDLPEGTRPQCTPLYFAIRHLNNKELIKSFVEAGADVTFPNEADKNGLELYMDTCAAAGAPTDDELIQLLQPNDAELGERPKKRRKLS